MKIPDETEVVDDPNSPSTDPDSPSTDPQDQPNREELDKIDEAPENTTEL